VSIVRTQFENLLKDYPEATIEERPDGTFVITIPFIPLNGGWNQDRVSVAFIAPVGFPLSQPDCFWTDDSLRLANGGLPKNTGFQTPPFASNPKLWFSWHLAAWNPARNSLKSFIGAIRERLLRAE